MVLRGRGRPVRGGEGEPFVEGGDPEAGLVGFGDGGSVGDDGAPEGLEEALGGHGGR